MIKHAIVVFLLLVSSVMMGQPYHSPFNPQMVDLPKDNGNYTFLVSGHFYGGSGSGSSGYPASTLLASTDLINATQADLFLSTGDMFINAAADHERYQVSLFNKLKMPLINAVGNHDLDGGQYERLFGKSHFSVQLGPDRLIVLDTEKDDSNIERDQLEMLESAADDMTAGALRYVFILSHRPVWAEEDDIYGPLFKNNTRSITGSNFGNDVYPILERIAENGQVYWFSGSMGGSAPSPIFYNNHSKGIHYVQSAIRDRAQDAILRAEVTPSGVKFNAISLTGDLMLPVNQLGVEYWRKHKGDITFNWKLIPYYVKSSITHKAFWFGVISALVVSFLLKRILRRHL